MSSPLPPGAHYERPWLRMRLRTYVPKEAQKRLKWRIDDPMQAASHAWSVYTAFCNGQFDPWAATKGRPQAPSVPTSPSLAVLTSQFMASYQAGVKQKAHIEPLLRAFVDDCPYKDLKGLLSSQGRQWLAGYSPAPAARRAKRAHKPPSKATTGSYNRSFNVFIGYLNAHHGAKLQPIKAPKTTRSGLLWLDEEQAMAIAAHLSQNGLPSYQAAALLTTIGFYTGLRRAELLALRPGDYEPAHGLLHIGYGADPANAFRTKSGRARSVVVGVQALSALERAIQAMPMKANPYELLFPPSLIKADRLQRLFKQALKKLYPHKSACSFKALRAGCGMWMLQQGQPMGHVSAQLGHASITTTQAHYVDLWVSYLRSKGLSG